MTVWDTIYKDFQKGGPAWATLQGSLHPAFAEFIKQTEFELKNALDIGCGTGNYLLFLRQLGFRVTGLDSSPTAISMARQEIGPAGEFIVADMYSYPYQANRYDLVISHAALHHGLKAQVLSLVEKIHGSLVLNGRVFLSFPSDECLERWPMMAGHVRLPDGTRIPTQGPEKGLPHSFFSKLEIEALFQGKYDPLTVQLDDQKRWIITGQRFG